MNEITAKVDKILDMANSPDKYVEACLDAKEMAEMMVKNILKAYDINMKTIADEPSFANKVDVLKRNNLVRPSSLEAFGQIDKLSKKASEEGVIDALDMGRLVEIVKAEYHRYAKFYCDANGQAVATKTLGAKSLFVAKLIVAVCYTIVASMLSLAVANMITAQGDADFGENIFYIVLLVMFAALEAILGMILWVWKGGLRYQ